MDERAAGGAAPDGRLEAIWVKRARGGKMDPVAAATLDQGGLVGNANRSYRRALTLIEQETFVRLRGELGDDVAPVMRRANFMLAGIRLEQTRGRLLAIGPCVLRIGGETRPCNLMDETFPGLQAALDPGWGGGAFATVARPGEIAVGDAVRWVESF